MSLSVAPIQPEPVSLCRNGAVVTEMTCCSARPRHSDVAKGPRPTSIAVATAATQEEVAAKYDLLSVVGTGQFAEVRHAVRRSDKRDLALKIIDKKNGALNLTHTNREAEIMLSLDHPSVMACYEVLETPDSVILVLELADNDLFSIYATECGSNIEGKSLEKQIAWHCKEIAEAYSYIHSQGIVHRDVYRHYATTPLHSPMSYLPADWASPFHKDDG